MPQPDPMYVGYLPVPTRIRRFIRPVVAGLLLLMVVAAVAIAARQRDPGDGVWGLGRTIEFEGVLVAEPHFILFENDGGVWRHALLVEQGKRVPTRLATQAGQRVRLRGVMLSRANVRLFELAGGDDLTVLGPATDALPRAPVAGPLPTHGEIIDPKCYAGAMKPGDGKTHKACAALCLRGGIPPMLRDARTGTLHLLVGPDHTPIGHALASIAGEPVTLENPVAERWADLPVVVVDPNEVRPLH